MKLVRLTERPGKLMAVVDIGEETMELWATNYDELATKIGLVLLDRRDVVDKAVSEIMNRLFPGDGQWFETPIEQDIRKILVKWFKPTGAG